MSECRCWRNGNTVARGKQMPQTIETLKNQWDMDQELIFEMAEEISKLKSKINKLEQKNNIGTN